MFVLIVGGGKVAEGLARALTTESQDEVVLLECDRDRYTVLLQRFPDCIVHGDGTEVRTLRAAGIERAEAVVAATGEDHVNLVAAELAAKHFGVGNVVARVNDPKNIELFRRAGVQHPVSSTHLLMQTIHQEVRPTALQRLASVRGTDHELLEVELPPGSAAAGREVRHVGLPPSTLLLAVLRGGAWTPLDMAAKLREKDVVLALAPLGTEPAIREAVAAK